MSEAGAGTCGRLGILNIKCGGCCCCSLGGFWSAVERGVWDDSGSLHGGRAAVFAMGTSGCWNGGMRGNQGSRPRSILGRSEESLPTEAATDEISLSLNLARSSVFGRLDAGCI
jgi:hypothetical protein